MKTLQDLLALDPSRQIIVYSRGWCGYCRAAKQVLAGMDLDFTEVDVETVPGALQEMLAKSEGRRTVPQIFINGVGIGGYTDLMHLLQQSAQQ